MTDFQDFQVDSAPPWMRGQLGTNWEYVFGLVKQGYLQAVKNAIKCRFPEYAPSDALDAVGAMLQIERAFARDDNAYIAQLMSAWEWRETAGTVGGMLSVLTKGAALRDVKIFESYNWSDGNPAWFFTVIAGTPVPWNADPLADGLWQDAGTWDDAGRWACGITEDDRARLRRLIHTWKPAHAECAAVIVNLQDGAIWDKAGETWDGGLTWDSAKLLYINMTV